MSRFVVLVLDGLRPDLVTPDTMPNLSDFRDRAAVLAGSRAQFPSHTRVNKTSFATGTTPHCHGIHFNRIFDPDIWTDRVIDIGQHHDVVAADKIAPVITATPLGQVLQGAGKRFAAVHCAMSGAPWLLNYRGDRFGQEHLSLAGYEHSTAEMAKRVRDRLGTMPDPRGVLHDRGRFALRAFREVVWPELRPDVAVIWSDEPDKSLHIDGLRGPTASAAIAHADRLVGELVTWWRGLPESEDVNLLILSDHGHVEKSGTVDLAAAFREAGLPVTDDPAAPGALLMPFGCGGIHLRDQPPERLAEIAAWMQEQPWLGTLFTKDGGDVEGTLPGTFAMSLVSVDHPRAPDLLFTTRRFDAGNGRPFAHCIDPSGKPAGSTHGGAHPGELKNVFCAAGPDFRERHLSAMTGGMIDVAPTMLHLLSVPQPDTMTGRALGDLLRDGTAASDVSPEIERHTVSEGAYSQSLELRRLTRRTVIESGRRH